MIQRGKIWYIRTGHGQQYNTAHAFYTLDKAGYKRTLMILYVTLIFFPRQQWLHERGKICGSLRHICVQGNTLVHTYPNSAMCQRCVPRYPNTIITAHCVIYGFDFKLCNAFTVQDYISGFYRKYRTIKHSDVRCCFTKQHCQLLVIKQHTKHAAVSSRLELVAAIKSQFSLVGWNVWYLQLTCVEHMISYTTLSKSCDRILVRTTHFTSCGIRFLWCNTCMPFQRCITAFCWYSFA